MESKWYDALFDQLADPTYDLVGDREGELEEYRTPDEFWVVSPSLAEALLKKGQLLTDCFGFWVWGRDTTLDSPLSLADDALPQSQLKSDVLIQIYKESLRS